MWKFMWLLTYLEKILCVLICMYLNFYPLEKLHSGFLLFLILSCDIKYFNK